MMVVAIILAVVAVVLEVGITVIANYRACCFGCFKGASTSVEVLLNGIEAVMVLTLMFLK